MDKELVKAFILECKYEKEWKDKWKSNHIEFDTYFKNSGWIEETKEVVKEWMYYNTVHTFPTGKRIYGNNFLHEKYESVKNKENDKNKSKKKRRTKEGFEFVGEE